MSSLTFYCYDNKDLRKEYFINHIMKNFKHITTLKNYVDFMWVEQINERFDKNSYTVKTYLKNILNDEKTKITDKDLLYKNLDGEFMAKSQTLFEKHLSTSMPNINHIEFEENKIYIVKPVGNGACSGNDIFIINGKDKLNDIVSMLHKKYNKAIICNYINDVALFNGRKFHLRMYLLVRMKTKTLPFLWSLHKTGKILTAKLPYKQDDYHNSLIHDTHAKSTDQDYFFPDDYPSDTEAIFNQLEKICERCAGIIKDIKGYDETTYAFEVFGLDIIIDSDNKAWLLEVNDKVGYSSVENNEKYTKFSNDYFNWVYKYGIKEIIEEKFNLIE